MQIDWNSNRERHPLGTDEIYDEVAVQNIDDHFCLCMCTYLTPSLAATRFHCDRCDKPLSLLTALAKASQNFNFFN